MTLHEIALERIAKVRQSQATELDLRNLKLETVPAEVWTLDWLTTLNLEANELTSLPPEIGQLTHLKKLDLRLNRLTMLPPEIGQLTSLQFLDLGRNQLSVLPSEIGQLITLEYLSLRLNPLTTLPPEIGYLYPLQLLLLDRNERLPKPLVSAYRSGLDDLRAYLRGLRDSERLFEAKLVLVGEGNVGKTSLVAALRDEQFVENRVTTHGIEVRSLTVRHPDGARDIQLNAWDFGGQSVYRITHQFFFSPRSLFLVVWWPREGVEQNDVEGWIERIQLRVGNGARVLVVASHTGPDGRVPRIDKEALRRRFGEVIVDFEEVDSRDGHRIAELRDKIAAAASKLPQMGEPMPSTWQRVREEIRRRSEQQVELPLSEYQAICQSEKLDEAATVALARLMNDLGDVVYFSEVQGLSDRLVLKPEWLTKAIGYVLEDRATNDAAGVLDWSRLPEIWSSRRSDREQYTPVFHPFFLRLMEQFDISYRLREMPGHSLVAQLVPAETPAAVGAFRDAATEDDLRLVCRMNAEATGLIPWLIVRTHEFAQDIHWQHGMLLRQPDHGEALIELVNDRRDLSITVRAAFPTYLMSVLSDTVDYLLQQRWPGLTYRWTVPCLTSGCGNLLNRDALLKRLDGASPELKTNCSECGIDWEIEALLQAVPRLPKSDRELFELSERFRMEVEATKSAMKSRAAWLMRLTHSRFALDDFPTFGTVTHTNDAGDDHVSNGRLWCQHPNREHPTDYPFGFIFEPKSATFIALVGASLELLKRAFGSEVGTMSDAELRSQESVRTQLKGEDSVLSRSSEDATSGIFSPHLWCDSKLRRVRGSDGRQLYVCEEHYRHYDTGLPDLHVTPTTVVPELPRPFTLESVRIENFRSIESLDLVLSGADSEQKQLPGDWTCLAGINGAGKTSILEAIALALLGPDLAPQILGRRLGRMVRKKASGPQVASVSLNAKWTPPGTTTPLETTLFLPLIMESEEAAQVDRAQIERLETETRDAIELRKWIAKFLFVSFGATRNLSDEVDRGREECSPLVERQQTLFRPLAQIPGLNALLSGGEKQTPALRTLYELLRHVLEVEGIEILPPEPGAPLKFEQLQSRLDSFQLPDGYRSTIGWLADLCHEWHRLHPEAKDQSGEEVLNHMAGIVLVDEIDLHLHPTLQRTLVPKLRRLLPHVQFIVTTHSPMVLACFDQSELRLLDRNAKGGIRELDRQIIGFTMNDLYRWLLGTGETSAVIEELEKQGQHEFVAELLHTSPTVDAKAAHERVAADLKFIQKYGAGETEPDDGEGEPCVT